MKNINFKRMFVTLTLGMGLLISSCNNVSENKFMKTSKFFLSYLLFFNSIFCESNGSTSQNDTDLFVIPENESLSSIIELDILNTSKTLCNTLSDEGCYDIKNQIPNFEDLFIQACNKIQTDNDFNYFIERVRDIKKIGDYIDSSDYWLEDASQDLFNFFEEQSFYLISTINCKKALVIKKSQNYLKNIMEHVICSTYHDKFRFCANPFIMSIITKNFCIANNLLKFKELNINSKERNTGLTALHFLALIKMGYSNCQGYFIQNFLEHSDLNFTVKDMKGRIPLHYAARNVDFYPLGQILEYHDKNDLNIKDNEGKISEEYTNNPIKINLFCKKRLEDEHFSFYDYYNHSLTRQDLEDEIEKYKKDNQIPEHMDIYYVHINCDPQRVIEINKNSSIIDFKNKIIQKGNYNLNYENTILSCGTKRFINETYLPEIKLCFLRIL